MKTTLKIEGMHCEKCAARLQKALLNRNGVIAAEVSKETDNAVVEYNEQQINAEELKCAVEDCGFSVSNN